MREKQSDQANTIDRILRERLEQFDVPSEVRAEIRRELLAFFQRPENKPYGATIMTPEASMAADLARKERRAQPPGPNTPKII